MTKKEDLRENLLASKLEIILPWVYEYKRIILGTIIAIVLIGTFSSVIIIRRKEANDLHWTQFSMAHALRAQNQHDQAHGILDSILSSESKASNKTRFFAHYYKGLTFLDQKKYQDAINEFNTVAQQYSDSPLQALAISDLAFSYEASGDFSMAAETYKQFLDQHAEHYLAPRNQWRWGATQLKAGEKEGGRATLHQLIDLYPTSPWAENARRLLDNN